MKSPLKWFLCVRSAVALPLQAVLLTHFSLATTAATYDVGPGQALAALHNVPWAALQPGDVVNIHAKPGGYHEKIQISASGTAGAHIVIRGIPDPATGALPVIDGKDAVEDPAFDPRHPKFTEWSLILVSPRATGYVYGQYHVSFVDIESLDIRNATYTGDGSITYTDQFGTVRAYGGFASGIYIEWAHDLAVRGCEISNCGNGLFANSKNGAAQSSARLLIEGNYFHDNSNPPTPDPDNPGGVPISNGYGEHHCYTESAGVIYQYNRFGPLRPGAHGTAIKDRSSGQVIRYNAFDMREQSNVLALLDPQGGSGYLDAQADYRDSFVYGNLITIQDYASGMSAFWWGAYNGSSSYAQQHRGVLHFYHNTIVNHHKAVALFFLPDQTYAGASPTLESVDCRNNIFFTDTALQNYIYDAMHFFAPGTNPNGGGDIVLGKNWISPNWAKEAPSHPYTGTLIGTENLIVGDAAGANNSPFTDLDAGDYRPLPDANVRDAAGPLPAEALPANDVTQEYVAPQSHRNRVAIGAAMDLGALEGGDGANAGPAPVIVAQPRSQIVVVGRNATFSVSASSDTALSYQWRKNATNLTGAVGASLVLTNVTTVHMGSYSVRVSDATGSVISSNATLTVTASLLKPPPADPVQLQTSGFRVTIDAWAARAHRLQWSTNLVDWVDLLSFSGQAEAFDFLDAGAVNAARRFYRVVSP